MTAIFLRPLPKKLLERCLALVNGGARPASAFLRAGNDSKEAPSVN